MSSSSSIITPPSTTPGGSSLGNSTVLQVISEEVDTQSCALLGPLAVAIQGLLGLAVLSSLLVKRARETPRRPWKIWAMDVSKQVIGQMFLHGSNLLISDVTALKHAKNSCSLYLCNILIDTTLGVFILYMCGERLHKCPAFHKLTASVQPAQILATGRLALHYSARLLRTPHWMVWRPASSFLLGQTASGLHWLSGWYEGCCRGHVRHLALALRDWRLAPGMGGRRPRRSSHHLYSCGARRHERFPSASHPAGRNSYRAQTDLGVPSQFLLIDQIIKGYSSFTLLSDEESPEPLLGDHNQLDDDEDDDDEGHSRVAPLDDSKSSRTGGDGASPSKTSFAKEAAYLDQHQNQTSLMESVTVEADPALKSRKDYGTSRPGSPSPTTAAETDRQT